jgi:phospholipid-binding lipoprotein MlaA
MFKNQLYILLIITILFSGCSDNLNIKLPTLFTNEVIDDELDEFEDEFLQEDEETSDPFRSYNVVVTNFNDKFYIYVFDPVARGYNYVASEDVRKSIKNFFHNLTYPIRLINNVLQGKFANAGEETGRFIVNSTVGLLGFFDPAKNYLDLQPHNEDFGQTLGYWGVGGGYHIVLPFLGPSNMRDMFSMYPDTLSNPSSYHDDTLMISIYKRLNNGSLKLGEYENLKKDAVALYPFLKDVYEQHRKKLIKE